MVIVIVDTCCTLGRAPRTKKTLPDFRERCRVTRHSRVFRGLTGCQRTPDFGASQVSSNSVTIGNFFDFLGDKLSVTQGKRFLRKSQKSGNDLD